MKIPNATSGYQFYRETNVAQVSGCVVGHPGIMEIIAEFGLVLFFVLVRNHGHILREVVHFLST